MISIMLEFFRITSCKSVGLPLEPGKKWIETDSQELLNYLTPFRQLVGSFLHF